MRFTAKQYALALHSAVSEAKPSDQDRILDNFVKLLKENRDLEMIDEIEKEFLDYDRSVHGVKIAQVSTARELSEAEESRIVDELNEHVAAKVELKKKIDKGLIGGVLIKIDDELIDGTVKGNLRDLKNILTT
ncbi:MAG: ATP synthase F1 subunit delta [bacterium]|nr:ATP synthase F1 subunit delta [bacterium]